MTVYENEKVGDEMCMRRNGKKGVYLFVYWFASSVGGSLFFFRFGMTVPGTCCDILVSDIPFPQCLFGFGQWLLGAWPLSGNR